MFAKVINGVVERYPYAVSDLLLDNPQVSFPRELSEELMTEYGVYSVVKVERPSSTLTQDAVEQTPQFIDGVWTQVWAMVDVSPEEVAQRQQEASDAAHAAAVKADTFVMNFIAMTPTQVEAYVTNNTANLGQVRALLTKMALILLALARKEYR